MVDHNVIQRSHSSTTVDISVIRNHEGMKPFVAERDGVGAPPYQSITEYLKRINEGNVTDDPIYMISTPISEHTVP